MSISLPSNVSPFCSELIYKATDSLYTPIALALKNLPARLRKEPEYILVGMIPAAVIHRARKETIMRYGLHLYRRIVSASILDPKALGKVSLPLVQESGHSFPFFSAVHLNAFPQFQGLPLYLCYLSSFPELGSNDYYDLLAHWFSAPVIVKYLTELFILALRSEVPCESEVVLKILSCDGYRSRVDWEEIERVCLVEGEGSVSVNEPLRSTPVIQLHRYR